MGRRIDKHARLITDQVHVRVLVVVVVGPTTDDVLSAAAAARLTAAVDGVGSCGRWGLRRRHQVVVGVDRQGHVRRARLIVAVGCRRARRVVLATAAWVPAAADRSPSASA